MDYLEKAVVPQEIDDNGWPIVSVAPIIDVEIPVALMFPRNLRPSAIPLTIVCGPPAAGKSTLVEKERKPGDVIIDLDQIVIELGGQSRTNDKALRKRAILERNRRLDALAYTSCTGHAWFITTAPYGATRRQWARMLGAKRVLLMLTPMDECKRRVRQDAERSAYAQDQERIIDAWFESYTTMVDDQVIEHRRAQST